MNKKPEGISALVIPAITDQEKSWYGIELLRNDFEIIIEDVDENYFYLKIQYKKSYKERIAEMEKVYKENA